MAIAFNCPHCLFAYRLKDELAGKQAKCKNPECRKLITIPTPITVPDDDAPMPDAAALEAAALDALADEPKAEDAPAEKVIPMTCAFCTHQWTEPRSKAGKNVICPNPECRQRMKVPEPKDDVPDDWRQQKTKLPSLAKERHEKPADVQDAGDAKIVSGQALKEADATGEEIEPRSLKDKAFNLFLAVSVLGGLAFGVWYLMQSRTDNKQHQLMADARTDFDKAAGDLPDAEKGLSSAILHAAESEYLLLGAENATELKKVQDLFLKARGEAAQQQALARHALAAELAVGVLAFGGTDEQVKDQVRYRWLPDLGGPSKLNESVPTVHEHLRQTLGLLDKADTDFKLTVARRVTRELVKKGQAGLAVGVPVALFGGQEQDEVRAAVALEILRADPGSERPKQIADSYKGPGPRTPASHPLLHVLLAKYDAVKLPNIVGNTSDGLLLAHVGVRLLGGNSAGALELIREFARAGGSVGGQLRALVLCAEWADDRTPAIDAAVKTVTVKGGTSGKIYPYHVLRLSQIAAEAGKYEQARALADALADDGLKAWAIGDGVRLRLAANPKEKANEAWLDLPPDPPTGQKSNLKAGHAWGALWAARQNARLSRSRDDEKKAIALWPAPAKPFGLAGIALGLQDQ